MGTHDLRLISYPFAHENFAKGHVEGFEFVVHQRAGSSHLDVHCYAAKRFRLVECYSINEFCKDNSPKIPKRLLGECADLNCTPDDDKFSASVLEMLWLSASQSLFSRVTGAVFQTECRAFSPPGGPRDSNQLQLLLHDRGWPVGNASARPIRSDAKEVIEKGLSGLQRSLQRVWNGLKSSLQRV